jgi:hypothetical protein
VPPSCPLAVLSYGDILGGPCGRDLSEAGGRRVSQWQSGKDTRSRGATAGHGRA